MDYVEKHARAVGRANYATRKRYGVESVPCEVGSEAHRFWLAEYDMALYPYGERGINLS